MPDNTPKVVCFVSHYTHLRMGGQQSMLALIKHVDRSRFLPMVVTPGPGELSDELTTMGCRVFHIPLCPIKPRLALQIYSNIKKLQSLFKRENVAIVHPDAERDAFVCGLACRKVTSKMVWHVRLTRQHHLDKFNLGFASALIGIAESVKDRFQTLPDLDQKYHTIYNGVDLNVFKPCDDKSALRKSLLKNLTLHPGSAIDTNQRGSMERQSQAPNRSTTMLEKAASGDIIQLIFVGQLKVGKGIFELVEAMHLLREQGLAPQQLQCLMIGAQHSPETQAELLEAIAQAGAEDCIHILPQQKNIQLWMQAADILILPSHEGVEGMGRVLFEAMACGTVAIGSDIAGIRDAITEDSGILFAPNSATAIAKTVQNLVAQPELRHRLVSGGLTRASAVFGIERHAELVQDLYARILES